MLRDCEFSKPAFDAIGEAKLGSDAIADGSWRVDELMKLCLLGGGGSPKTALSLACDVVPI